MISIYTDETTIIVKHIKFSPIYNGYETQKSVLYRWPPGSLVDMDTCFTQVGSRREEVRDRCLTSVSHRTCPGVYEGPPWESGWKNWSNSFSFYFKQSFLFNVLECKSSEKEGSDRLISDCFGYFRFGYVIWTTLRTQTRCNSKILKPTCTLSLFVQYWQQISSFGVRTFLVSLVMYLY